MGVWTGPFRLSSKIDQPGGWPEADLPPEVPGLYLCSDKLWTSRPFGVLYTGKSGNLLGRLEEHVSALIGLWGANSGRGEMYVVNRDYIRPLVKNPMALYIAWFPMPDADEDHLDETETQFIQGLDPEENPNLCNTAKLSILQKAYYRKSGWRK